MSQTRQRSLLPLFGLTAPQAFQAALQGTRTTPRTVMTGGRPRLVGADVPAAPLRPTPITRADMPLGRAAMSPLAMGASAPLPQEPTMLQRLQADKPFSAGLQAAGQALSEASGYTALPKDTLGMINQAMAAFNQAQQKRAMFEADMAMKQKQREQDLALEYAKLNKPSDFLTKLQMAGIDPTTPEGQEQVRKMLMKPQSQVNVDLGKKFGEESIKFAFDQLKLDMAELRQSRSLLPKINTVIPILEAALQEGRDITGIVSSVTFPFRKAMVESGLLGEDAARDVSDFEVLRASTAFMIPRMRVVGSGATSDFEAKMMQDAVPNMLNSVAGNLVIAALFKQTTEHNMARVQLQERFINKHQSLYDEKNDIGFGDYADKTLDKVFYTVGTEEELTELVDAGKIKKGQAYFNSDPNFNQFIIYRGE